MKFTSYNMFLSDLFRHGLDYACERATRLGFSGVELLDFCPLRSKATYEKYSVDEYKRALDKNKLELSCYSSAALLYVSNEEALMEEMRKQIDFASALGSKLFHHTFTICLPPEHASIPVKDMLDRVAPVAERIADYADGKGVTCIYEPQGSFFNGSEGLSLLYDEMVSRVSNVGICADVGNPLFADDSPEAVTALFADKVKHVHLKD